MVQKLTRESALCAVSEPEASPYCVSPGVAFVSVLVAPDRFLPYALPPPACPSARYCRLRPFVSRWLVSLSRIFSRQKRARTLSSAQRQKGELCAILRVVRALSLSLSLCKAGESGKIAVREFTHSSFSHSAYSTSRSGQGG